MSGYNTVCSRIGGQEKEVCIYIKVSYKIFRRGGEGGGTHHLSLLIWSPNPGVSVTDSFRRTPCSSITAGNIQHPHM